MADISIFGYTFSLEILILIGIMYLIVVGHTVSGCCNHDKIAEGFNNMMKEGFSGASTNNTESSVFNLASDIPINTASWFSPPAPSFVQRQLPLPEGEMDYFANVQFKPDCCPSSYSNSTGCACLGKPDEKFLMERAGNNTPYSEY